MIVTLVARNENKPTGISYCEREILRRLKKHGTFRIIEASSYPQGSKIQKYLHFARSFFQGKNVEKTKEMVHLLDQQLAYSLNFTTPKEKVVATVYDMYSFFPEYKKTYSLMKKVRYWMVNRGLSKADYFITISKTIKMQIQKILGAPSDKIFLVSLGLNHKKFRRIKVNRQRLCNKYKIPNGKKIILYVGAEKPQKNLAALLRAVPLIQKRAKDAVLVKIGAPQDDKMRQTHKQIIEKPQIKGVYFTETIPEKDLVQFYNIAEVFVMPSIDEAGFDLPVVEAMACGCPIVYCDASLKETVDFAGIKADPIPESIAEHTIAVLTDEKYRNKLVQKSIAQASKFDWEKTAKQLMEIYKKITATP